MKCQLVEANASYELIFGSPIFSLPKVSVDILETFYAFLNPRFPLSLRDMQVSGGQALSDVAVRFHLFNGAALLELTAGRFGAEFRNIRARDDLKTVTDVLDLCDQALQKIPPQPVRRSTTIRVASWFSCEGAAEAVRTRLRQLGDAGIKLPIAEFGASNLNSALRGELENPKEGWSFTYLFERSLIPTSHLFYVAETRYGEPSKFGSVRERSDHVEKLFVGVMQRAGFELS